MNQLDFTIPQGWPASTETWQWLQSMSNTAQLAALLGGKNYILDGCVEASGNVGNGLMVINGEILPFEGGPLQPNLIVVDTATQRAFFGGDVNNYYHERKVVFGSGPGSVAYASLLRNSGNVGLIKRLNDLETALATLTAAFNTHTHAWSAITGKPLGYITYVSAYAIGDVLPSPNFTHVTVTIPNQGGTNYKVLGAIKGATADGNFDNNLTWSVSQLTATSFKLSVREVAGLTQNVTFDFSIVKTL